MRNLKLNHDCVRDCLLYLESTGRVQISTDEYGIELSLDSIPIQAVFDGVTNWTNQDIFYALFNLEQIGYIDVSKMASNNCTSEYWINYITFQGHEFLDSVRDDTRWQGIKKGLGAVRNYSLSAINAIAEGMTSGAISAYLSRQATS